MTPRAWGLLACLCAILLLAMCGCGGSATEPERECAVAFDPDPLLADVTDEWARRWSSATGCDVRVESGGIPVLGVQESSIDDGKVRCGSTKRLYRGKETIRILSVEIDLTPPDGCVGWGYSVGHELGHAIGALGHTESGLMVDRLPLGVVHMIDAPSLELVCAELPCSAFNPEF